MTDQNTYQTVDLELRGDGSALKLVEGVSTFSLTDVQLEPSIVPTGIVSPEAKVSYVPDPDNEEQNTIFWVQAAVPWSPTPASGTITLKLTYAPE